MSIFKGTFVAKLKDMSLSKLSDITFDSQVYMPEAAIDIILLCL